MQTPIVQEIRRAGQEAKEAAHLRQVQLVARSLTALPDRRISQWDERTRTEDRVVAA
jgi:hypothetical protein